MNKKINKERTEDLFAGLKFVDNMLNEAAGLKSTPKLTLDARLKKRLSESIEEGSTADISMESTNPFAKQNTDDAAETDATTQLESEMSFQEEDMNEYNYTGDGYNYNYDGKDKQYGEDVNEGDGAEDEDPDLLEMLLEDDDTLAVEDPTTDMAGTPGDDLAGGAPGMDAGADAGLDMGADTGMADLGAPAPGDALDGMPTDDLGVDAGLDAGMAGGVGASMGGGAGLGAEPTVTATSIDMTAGPEDIDALIDSLLLENQELKDLGYEDLGDDEITARVKAGQNKGPKVQIDSVPATTPTEDVANALQENETPKSTKLDTEDITGNVKGAGEENKSGDPTGANKDLKFVDAKDKDFASNKVKDEKAGTLNQPEFAKVKKESADKDKALVQLAKKYAMLEDEIKSLKLENYKAKKVNAVLTLLPELKQSTREALVTSFSEAKDYATVRKLYEDVQKMVKESKRPSLNEAVTKATKSIKHIIAENTNENEGSESDEQKRKNFLMGMPGYDDSYGS